MAKINKSKKQIFYLLISLSLFSLCSLRLEGNAESGLDYLKKGVSLWDAELLKKAEKEFLKTGDVYHLSLSEYRLATYYFISDNNLLAKHFAEEGIKNVKKALRQNRNIASCYAVLGNLYGIITGVSSNPLTMAKYGFLCMKNLKKAVEIEPENAFALLSLGIAYFNTPVKYGGGVAKAQKMFKKAMAADPENAEIYIWLSKYSLKIGDEKKAEYYIKEALRCDPQNNWARNIQITLEKKQKNNITGKVIDAETGKPLSWVNVIVEGTTMGGISNDNGYFLIRSVKKGNYRLRFKRIGYEDVLQEIDLNTETKPVFVSMKQSAVAIEGITVKANPVYDKKQKGEQVITPVELWRLPGSGAELFWGLKSLPGASGDDIAPIIVRGGNPKENIILFDGIRLKHPFHLESLNGGLTSFFEPSMLSSVSFISGGFGAKYGDGLSSVVDVNTRNPSYSSRGRCSISLANGYIDFEGRLTKKLSYIMLLRGGTSYLVSHLGGSLNEFKTVPVYYDLFSKIVYHYSPSSNLRIVGAGDSDLMEPRIDDHHTYLSKTRQKIISVVNTSLFKNGVLNERFSFVHFFRADEIKTYYENRTVENQVDCALGFSRELDLHSIETGGGFENGVKNEQGLFPVDSLRFLNPASDIIDYDEHLCTNRVYYFLQDEWKTTRKIAIKPGMRITYFSYNKELDIEPRFSFAYLFAKNTTLRFKTGIYHQSTNSISGVPDAGLSNEKSCHYVLGIERRLKTGRFLLEGFYKSYKNLPIKTDGGYTSQGYGFSRGLDVLYQLNMGFFQTLLVYSFTDSKRMEMDAKYLTTSNYEIPNSLTISLTADLLPYFSFGAKYRYHTGRVYTPVLYGKYDEVKEEWIPVFGRKNSARFPAYRRIDIQFSKIVSIGNNGIVLFTECENLLNANNITRYYYSQDFSEKQAITVMTRTIVAGFMLYF